MNETVTVFARLDVQTIDEHGEIVADGATQELLGGQIGIGLDVRDDKYERFAKVEAGWRPRNTDEVHHFVGAALARVIPGGSYEALDEKTVSWPDLYLLAPARKTNVEVRQLDDDAVRNLNAGKHPLSSDFDALAAAVSRALKEKTENKYPAVEMSRAWLALYLPLPSTPAVRDEIRRAVNGFSASSRNFFWQVCLVDVGGHAERMAIRS